MSFWLMSKIFVLSLIVVIAAVFYITNPKRIHKNEEIKLQFFKNDDMINRVATPIQEDYLRSKIVDELSRQTLVFSEEEGTWVKRRQIN